MRERDRNREIEKNMWRVLRKSNTRIRKNVFELKIDKKKEEDQRQMKSDEKPFFFVSIQLKFLSCFFHTSKKMQLENVIFLLLPLKKSLMLDETH